MRTDTARLFEAVETIPDTVGAAIEVRLSTELIRLLSDQLYQSPLKAVEELVINSFDADAGECRVFVPDPTEQSTAGGRKYLVFYDDGVGMDYEGMVNLWHIGRSNKRTEEIQKRRKRTQIGRFGIGKLATYTIANQLTYISRTGDQILTVTVDFRQFSEDPSGAGRAVPLVVKNVSDWDELAQHATFREMCDAAHVSVEALFRPETPHWTIAVLEDLKPKAQKIRQGRLEWVLRTAMPLQTDFKLFLNGTEIKSAKETMERVAEFSLADLPSERISALITSTGLPWSISGHSLVSPMFPAGITGNVIVTKEPLSTGKSSDLGRSYGFFVRVLGRLINEEDPQFGVVSPLTYKYIIRTHADIRADDLDRVLTASREAIEDSLEKTTFQTLLREVFNEARQRYNDYEKKLEEESKRKKEKDRGFVNPRLVEHPVADVLFANLHEPDGAEADENWFYLEVPRGTDVRAVIQELYSESIVESRRQKYRYEYTGMGRSRRLVKFDPVNSVFYINSDHLLVQAHREETTGGTLLEDFVTAEAMLEVYLRENRVPPHVVGEVLERRDSLMRSLAQDHPYSVAQISATLRDAAADQYDLEINVVAAARALGFVATHISGDGEPDGVARFTEYSQGERKIVLEAKSSGSVPTLAAIDFAGLHEHMLAHEAQGCLLVAPDYPGKSRGDESAAANRARELRISCWTIDQLARVVAEAEARHITAQDVLDIVLNRFTPEEVTESVDEMLAAPKWNQRSLYGAIVDALRDLENRLPDAPRDISMVAYYVSNVPEYKGIERREIREAVSDLAPASLGSLSLRGDNIILHASIDEIERRLNGLLRRAGEPRRPSLFRDRGRPD